MSRVDCVYREGYIGINKHGLEFKVLSRVGRKCEVQFTITGATYIVSSENVRTGTIKDYMSPSIAGVGVIAFKGATSHPLFRRWKSMILRCYDKNDRDYKTYGAMGVTVCEEWHNFKNYITDIENMENYDKLLKDSVNWHIDKDISGGKIYSRETVAIITKSENCSERARRGVQNLYDKKPVLQLSLDGEFIAEYESIMEAKRVTGINTISGVCHGKRKTAGGYRWEFKNSN